MPASHTITYRCDYCEAEHENIVDGMVLPFTNMMTCLVPRGWSWVGDKIVCPNHTVDIDAFVEPDVSGVVANIDVAG